MVPTRATPSGVQALREPRGRDARPRAPGGNRSRTGVGWTPEAGRPYLRPVWLLAAWLLVLTLDVLGAASHTRARLLLEAESAPPGSTVLAGVLLEMEPGWHTYWVNPGDSGGATEIAWQLPEGITAGEIQWPVPDKYDVAGLNTYVLHDRALLVVPLQLSEQLPAGQYDLKAKVSWLECAELCLPGETDVRASLTVGPERKTSSAAAEFERARSNQPRAEGAPAVRATWGASVDDKTRTLRIEWPGTGDAGESDFLPLTGADFEVSAVTKRLTGDAGLRCLEKEVRRSKGNWPLEIPGVLIDRRQPELVAYQVKLRPVTAGGAAASDSPAGSTKVASPAPPQRSLVAMLLFAFVGGLILNVMPCVLPVIALKVLSFVRQSKDSPAAVRRHGLLYGVGVLASFAVLAVIVIAVGRLASWGMQFQSPAFLLVMTTLITLVALNLFGVFEVTLGGSTMGAAAQLASKEGAAGAFFNGVLATTLATPCTAPFLGTAVGFAFTQPPLVILVMFLFIGLGLAAPYVLISFVPGFARFLPKPGLWMERFKVAMGFPMLAAAMWLLSLLSRHYGTSGVLWIGVFLTCVALAAWIWGQFVQRGSVRRGLAIVGSIVFLAAGYGLALEAQLDWRSPRTVTKSAVSVGDQGIPWQPWNPDAVAKARAEGRVVLVDFTADWCVTCQANKKTSIEIPSVEAKLRELGAATFLGDYTLKDDAITEELKRFGRAGVPLVLVYPKRPDAPPIVLPELLTPSIMLEALAKAATFP